MKIGRYQWFILTVMISLMVSCAGGNKSHLARPIQIDFSEVPEGQSSDLNPEAGLNEFEDEFGNPSDEPVFDPLSGHNRRITMFNDKFFDWVVEPVSKGYNFIIPEGGRIGVNRFFKNLFFPIRFVNNVLQLIYNKAATETARFLINSTTGLLGFFDPAVTWFELDPAPEDFGQTLGFYGVGGGFHIVLPFLGPSNVRDFVGLGPDIYATPLADIPETGVAFDAETYRRLNDASLRLDEYKSLRKDALDFYTFLRDAYERNRKAQIKE